MLRFTKDASTYLLKSHVFVIGLIAYLFSCYRAQILGLGYWNESHNRINQDLWQAMEQLFYFEKAYPDEFGGDVSVTAAYETAMNKVHQEVRRLICIDLFFRGFLFSSQ